MKPSLAAIMALTGLLTLFNRPLSGQETPATPPGDPPAPQAAAPTTPEDPPQVRRAPPADRRGRPGPGPRVEDQVPAPYIGVLTGPVSLELRSHFNLPEGFGLLVQEVMKDTPAMAAGIKENDVLVRFEDQKLVNMEQLQTLVRSKRKGDTVPLTVISNGQETQLTVVIDERLMPRTLMPERFGGARRPSFFDVSPEGADRMRNMRDTLERYERQMEAYRDRLRGWDREEGRGRERDRGRDRGTGIVPTPPRNDWDRNLPEPDLERKEDSRSSESRQRGTAHITRSDDSGVYTLRKENGRTLFTAKPKEGTERTWNVDNEEERRSIPEQEKAKLQQLEEIRGHEEGPRSNGL